MRSGASSIPRRFPSRPHAWSTCRLDTADIPAQDLITKDNVTIRVEAAVL
jgi:regulator of protease activity HflC (stomatin/prohibitin superfamily)